MARKAKIVIDQTKRTKQVFVGIHGRNGSKLHNSESFDKPAAAKKNVLATLEALLTGQVVCTNPDHIKIASSIQEAITARLEKFKATGK